jgi:hypothetical protein
MTSRHRPFDHTVPVALASIAARRWADAHEDTVEGPATRQDVLQPIARSFPPQLRAPEPSPTVAAARADARRACASARYGDRDVGAGRFLSASRLSSIVREGVTGGNRSAYSGPEASGRL